MIAPEQALRMLETADEICSAEMVSAAVKRLATEISVKLGGHNPLVLSVMGGAVVFTGQLLPLLCFPLDFDYIHVSRYGNDTRGGEIVWRALPRDSVAGRAVLVLDDILDEGHTMAAIRDKIMELGAASFHSAVFAEKETGLAKPISADFVGITVPDRFVFGFGMDAHGAWRNLPAVYALKQE
jgi:hypoxanthine phosphoribosyltransferase